MTLPTHNYYQPFMQRTTTGQRRVLFILVPLIIVSLFLLLRSQSFVESLDFRGDYRPHYFPPPGGLRKWIAEEDQRYNIAIANRHDLIRKEGPNMEDLKSFPGGGRFYTLWDFFIPAFRCPHSTQRVGALADGGKWVCGMELVETAKKCVVYSFGVSTDSSFEAEVLARAPNCEVWGYDFSVDSWGPQITSDPAFTERAHFHKWGVGGEDKHEPTDWPPMYTLKTLMEMNGHDHIDILKVDIEGSEFDALTALVQAYSHENGGILPFSQLQLEIHAWSPHDEFKYFLNWWESLEHAGLRPFWFEPNLVYVDMLHARPDAVEYAFINIHANSRLVSD